MIRRGWRYFATARTTTVIVRVDFGVLPDFAVLTASEQIAASFVVVKVFASLLRVQPPPTRHVALPAEAGVSSLVVAIDVFRARTRTGFTGCDGADSAGMPAAALTVLTLKVYAVHGSSFLNTHDVSLVVQLLPPGEAVTVYFTALRESDAGIDQRTSTARSAIDVARVMRTELSGLICTVPSGNGAAADPAAAADASALG